MELLQMKIHDKKKAYLKYQIPISKYMSRNKIYEFNDVHFNIFNSIQNIIFFFLENVLIIVGKVSEFA